MSEKIFRKWPKTTTERLKTPHSLEKTPAAKPSKYSCELLCFTGGVYSRARRVHVKNWRRDNYYKRRVCKFAVQFRTCKHTAPTYTSHTIVSRTESAHNWQWREEYVKDTLVGFNVILRKYTKLVQKHWPELINLI